MSVCLCVCLTVCSCVCFSVAELKQLYSILHCTPPGLGCNDLYKSFDLPDTITEWGTFISSGAEQFHPRDRLYSHVDLCTQISSSPGLVPRLISQAFIAWERGYASIFILQSIKAWEISLGTRLRKYFHTACDKSLGDKPGNEVEPPYV